MRRSSSTKLITPSTSKTADLKEMFGSWTREEAVRASARTDMLRTSFKEDLLAALDTQRKDFKDEMHIQGLRFEETMRTSLLGYTPVTEFRSLSDRVDALATQVGALSHHKPRSSGSKPVVSTSVKRSNARYDDFVVDSSDDELPDDQGVSHEENRSQYTKKRTSSHIRQDKTTSSSSMVTRSIPTKQDQLGPEEYGLSDLTPTDRRFTNVLSYRRYRLQDTSSQMGSSVSRNLGVWIRRLKHQMQRNIFDGKNPVSILNFLGSYKKACDGEQVPEAAALQMAPHFLDGAPRDEFEAMMDDANGGSGGFNTWPHAVQWLLETYATNSYIEKAIEDLEGLQMQPRESIKQFEMRLRSHARDLAGAYPLDSLVNRFIRNLPQDIRAIVRLQAPLYTGPTALTKISELATAYHAAHSAIKQPPQKGVRFQALSVEHASSVRGGDPSSVANLAPPVLRRSIPGGDPVSMAASGSMPYTPSSDYTPTVEYSTRDSNVGGSIGTQMDGVHAVSDTRRQFPSRQPRPSTPPRRENFGIPLVCFNCYLIGHRSTECIHKERIGQTDFAEYQRRNFAALEDWQQGWLKSIKRAPSQISSPIVDGPRSLPPNATLMTQEKK